MKNSVKTPSWFRFIQIGLGILVVILAILIIINPIAGLISIVLFLGIILLMVGIEQVVVGLYYRGRSRLSSIGLGILVMALASIVIIYPTFTSMFIVFLVGFALMFDGISRIIKGINNKHEEKSWSRAFSIGSGILSIVLSVMILIFPVVGEIFVGLLIGLAALVIGSQIIMEGLVGRIRINSSNGADSYTGRHIDQ